MSSLNTKRTCPFCAEEIRVEAVKCRWCGSYLEEPPLRSEWRRREDGRLLAGVCAGLAYQFRVSVTVVRLAFVISFILGFGAALIIYFILWIIMPLQEEPFPPEAGADDSLEFD